MSLVMARWWDKRNVVRSRSMAGNPRFPMQGSFMDVHAPAPDM